MRLLLKIYKLTISPLLLFLFGGGGCKYTPTCSEYSVLMIEKHGIIKGVILGIKRILSCNSFTK